MIRFLITTMIVVLMSQTTIAIEFKTENNSYKNQITNNVTSIPLSFTENKGQWNKKIKFRASIGGNSLLFASDGTYYKFIRNIVTSESNLIDSVETMMIKAQFVGSNSNSEIVGLDKMEYKCNYFIGSDKSKWTTNVANFTGIKYVDIYDGIDLKYYSNGKQMEYDFIVSPNADYSQIKIQYEGVESIAINDNDELVIETMWGEVVEQKPLVYQMINEKRHIIKTEFELRGVNEFGFNIKDDIDTEYSLIIDPLLRFSGFHGGTGGEIGTGVAVDPFGSIYVTGYTSSDSSFPIINPYQPTRNGISFDAFVSKFNSNGFLLYSTYIGGNKHDNSNSIIVDDSWNTYICGHTYSTDFPVNNAQQASNSGMKDAFVVKLNQYGDSLLYSSMLGGTSDEECYGIAIDTSGSAYVVGWTESSDFPVLNAIKSTIDDKDGFLTKFSPSGDSHIFSSYIGGYLDDAVLDVALNDSGSAYLTGWTNSPNFPIFISSVEPLYQGGKDAYVMKFAPDGQSLDYSTYLGSNGDETGYGIGVDMYGNAYVTGQTQSANFPVANSAQATYGGNGDAFVSKISNDGTNLMYSTYLGGAGTEKARAIAVAKSGLVTITGYTNSVDFPLEDYPIYNGASYSYNGGVSDAFVTQFLLYGNGLLSSNYLGGAGEDVGYDVVSVDSSNLIYLTGFTGSNDFPTINNAGSYQGAWDAYLAVLDGMATDITEYNPDYLPAEFMMSQNYPNPFNPTTTIGFNLPTKSAVTINIYNLLGQQVHQLVNQEFSAGNYKVTWDGTASNGKQASTGIYLYRLETENFVETKKMLLIK